MYSEMHPTHRQVWIGNQDSMWHASDHKITKRAVANKANSARYMPNEKSLLLLAAFAAKQYKMDSLRVQVWEPVLNPENNSMSSKLIREVNYAVKP